MASLLNMSGGSLLKKGLPYDAEIEYLESSGTQWIDTGYKPNSATQIIYECELASFTNDAQSFFGVANSSLWSNNAFTVSTWLKGSYGYGNSGNAGHAKFEIQINTVTTFTLDSTGMYVNETMVNSNSTYTLNQMVNNLFFFAANYSGAQEKSPHTFYSAQIRENNILVRDFIPVRVGNVGYMYDKVTNQLFGNAGTGNFILGPDKTN